MNNKIFVSIASYKDPELLNTINDLFENSKNPDNIRVVVLYQTDFNTTDHKIYFENRKVEIVSIDFRNSKGVSWIRSKIQHFIDDESYYLQIDSHMRFGLDWDDKLISYLDKCNSTKPVITFYPSPYDLEVGKIQNNIIKNEIRGFNRKALSSFGISMDTNLCGLDNGDNFPIPGTTIAAGFLFTSIQYVKEVPYDNNLFWNYEETDQTLRGFTYGWDFFGLPECLVWHKYNTTGILSHYRDIKDSNGMENKSNEYAENKYFNPNFNTDYPLGNVRTLKEFEILNNLNFDTGIITTPDIKDMLIVVPYRDREDHLKSYLELVPKYFNDRGITYDILIAELDMIGDWNAGLSCNSVINFKKKGTYKYLYIHHVDVYPVEGDWKYPGQNELFYNLGDWGSTLLNYNDFFKIGGYRNGFWGWGAEDNDLNLRAFNNGISLINVKEMEGYNVVFDEGYQNHGRPFVSKNYSNSTNMLKIPSNRNVDSIFDTNHYGTTHSLVKLDDNIYKHNIKPLKMSPNSTVNKNLVLSYIKDISKETIYPFIKSVSLYSPYNYDIVVIDASTVKNDHIINELISFGIKVVRRDMTLVDNLFLDRLDAYSDFANKNSYEKILCVDFTDIIFQGNPFDILKDLPDDKILLTSEGIKINDQPWNSIVIDIGYGAIFREIIGIYEVLNCGVMFGTAKTITELKDTILGEFNKLPENIQKIVGIDQAIILFAIYGSQLLKVNTIGCEIPLAVHLHTLVNDGVEKNRFKNTQIINNMIVKNENGELFKIVHQYNRSNEMYFKILGYYNDNYYSPLT